MSTSFFVLLLLGLVLAVYVGLALRAYVRMRGQRVVVCPETNQPVGVNVDAAHAAMTAVWEKPEIQLKSCTRWPERQDCNQACTGQIAVGPEDTLVSTMLKRWYAGKSCAICRRPIPEIQASHPQPGLLNIASPGREILSWAEVPADKLPAVLESHLAICAECHLAEVFRRQFPDRATDRADTPVRDRVYH